MEITGLVGKYIIEGSNQDEKGTYYNGTLTLSIKSDNRINAVWQIGSDQIQYGIGFFKNEMLVINFHYEGDDQSMYYGVVAYQCNKQGVINGVWSEERGDAKYVGVEKGKKVQEEYIN